MPCLFLQTIYDKREAILKSIFCFTSIFVNLKSYKLHSYLSEKKHTLFILIDFKRD